VLSAAISLLFAAPALSTAQSADVQLSRLGLGWARSSVNAVSFRTASLASHDGTQYAAYYDDSAHVVLAKRRIGNATWTLARTTYTNDVSDAHNAIAIAVDGSGVLHGRDGRGGVGGPAGE
jgi:hypothetical protein